MYFIIISSIDINAIGMCNNAIVINLSEEEILKYKKELLKKLHFYK